jgi:hypothetical protein
MDIGIIRSGHIGSTLAIIWQRSGTGVDCQFAWSRFPNSPGQRQLLHGVNQDGLVKIVARNDASTNGLPKTWLFRDEWYNLEAFPRA